MNSATSTPVASARNSPTLDEDEITRHLLQTDLSSTPTNDSFFSPVGSFSSRTSPSDSPVEKTIHFSENSVFWRVFLAGSEKKLSGVFTRELPSKSHTVEIVLSAPSVARFSASLGIATTLMTYLVGAITASQNGSGLLWWPLSTISVYGATLPAAWIFRAGFVTSGASIVLFSVMIKRTLWFRRIYLLLFVAGFCLISCSAISCAENNSLHSSLAVLFFFLCAIFFIAFGFVVKGADAGGGNASLKQLRLHGLLGGAFLLFELTFLTLLFAKVILMEKTYVLPLLEWPGVVIILSFLWHLAAYIEKEGVPLEVLDGRNIDDGYMDLATEGKLGVL